MKFSLTSVEKKLTYCSDVQEDGIIYLTEISKFNDRSVYVRFIKRTPCRDEVEYANTYRSLEDAFDNNIYVRMAMEN